MCVEVYYIARIGDRLMPDVKNDKSIEIIAREAMRK
jgi:hypothetical protein